MNGICTGTFVQFYAIYAVAEAHLQTIYLLDNPLFLIDPNLSMTEKLNE